MYCIFIMVEKEKNMVEIYSCISEDIHSNTYLVVDKETREAAVIDPSREAAVFGVDLENVKIKYVLLTHGHFDHMFRLGDYYGGTSQICVHALDSDKLTNPEANCSELFMRRGMVWQNPDITLFDGDKLYLGETEICVLHTPGHTMGSVCYTVGDAMFTGDTLFFGSIGRTDFSGSDISSMRESLGKLKKIEKNYRLYTGHGQGTTLDNEKEHNSYLLYV